MSSAPFRRNCSVPAEVTSDVAKLLQHYVSYKAAIAICGGIGGGAVIINQWGTSSQIGQLKGDMIARIAEVKEQLKADIAAVKVDVAEGKEQLKADIAAVKMDMAGMKADLGAVKRDMAEVLRKLEVLSSR